MPRPSDRLPADSVRTFARDLIQTLLDCARVGDCPDAEFAGARLALECLPLTQAEFAVATNRLASARSYLQDGERGAARFELRLLMQSL